MHNDAPFNAPRQRIDEFVVFLYLA
jgi:hypothetical protein